jgi:hypothetical protein
MEGPAAFRNRREAFFEENPRPAAFLRNRGRSVKLFWLTGFALAKNPLQPYLPEVIKNSLPHLARALLKSL